MFLKKEKLYKEAAVLLGILTYAYFVNWQSGNIGVMPIDSFGFLDTGYSILKGHLPIRDFWIFTGLMVDYMEAAFIYIFGNNWNSHLAHSSFMNIVGSMGLYFFLKEYDLKISYIVFYCLSFATLCYPLSGTPFAYIHAYIFSLIAIFTLLIAIKKNNKILWFLIPYPCLFGFLSMQTPTAYILIILLILVIFHFYKEKNIQNLKFFIFGCISSILIFLLFLFLTQTPIENFIYQYLLFPLTIGEGRITSKDIAFISLIDQINFKRLIGEFKFIHIFFIPLIFFALRNIKRNDKNLNTLNFAIIISVFAFLFNQLITANQIYIFSLIPILAAIVHINFMILKIDMRFFYLIIFVVLFATTKFHLRFNVDRKFIDIEYVSKTNLIDGNIISSKINGLRWVTKHTNKKNFDEVSLIKQSIDFLRDKKGSIIITNYQFILSELEHDIYSPNRWYTSDGVSYPTKENKFHEYYKDFYQKKLIKNKVKKIYTIKPLDIKTFDFLLPKKKWLNIV